MIMPPKIIIKRAVRGDGRVINYAFIYAWHPRYRTYKQHTKLNFMANGKTKVTRVGLF